MIVYKLFQTPAKYYVYDRNRNRILEVGRKDYKELEQLQNGKITESEAQCLKRYQKHGFLKESVLEEIVHPEVNHVCHYLEHRVESLILQVTQNCNLRCAYCAYSGRYNNRVHNNKVMDWETAKESLDYLFSHSSELKSVHIGFYGGEPLLCFDLIRQCVEYVKECYGDRTVTYGITTNGTLLTIETGQYLSKHNFAITVSLDGSKKDHDKNRVFASGGGSFDTIMHNIKALAASDETFMQHLRFNTVLSPESDYGAVRNYFETEDMVSRAEVGIGFMESSNCKEDIVFGDEIVKNQQFMFLQVALSMLHKLRKEKLSNVSNALLGQMLTDYDQLNQNHCMGTKCQHSGPCIPGATRMFVSADRAIYSCEKASEANDLMRIGTLDDGINTEKVVQAMNCGDICKEECKQCWAFQWCSLCSLEMEKDGKLDLETTKENCKFAKRDVLERMIQVCVLKEYV